jgi:hypothetical protein
MSESFQERFSRHFEVPADRYLEAMLRRTLYRRARVLRWLLPDEFFACDRDLIVSVGRVTRRQDFSEEVKEFQYDPRNRSFWRRTGCFRVSSARMQAVFDEVWPKPAAGRAEVV